MNLSFDPNLAAGYKSPSQIIRRLSEGWAEENMYCPRCGEPHIRHFPNNQKVADFYCPQCAQQYEMKSTNGPIGDKIMDGTYATFIERIKGRNNPDFLIMSYCLKNLVVESLCIIPKHFFHEGIVEKRPPLSQTARRAGWIGCNIIISSIPVQGRIYIVRDKTVVSPALVQKQLHMAEALNTDRVEARGWLFDTLNCINSLPSQSFTLQDVYRFEEKLALLYPNNQNIRPKIRQQLQVLRDRGMIEFLGDGHYQKILYKE